MFLTVEVMDFSASWRPTGSTYIGMPEYVEEVVACLMYLRTSSSGVSSLNDLETVSFSFSRIRRDLSS